MTIVFSNFHKFSIKFSLLTIYCDTIKTVFSTPKYSTKTVFVRAYLKNVLSNSLSFRRKKFKQCFQRSNVKIHFTYCFLLHPHTTAHPIFITIFCDNQLSFYLFLECGNMRNHTDESVAFCQMH